MIITLIGYRGSGKSTVAAPLAQRLGWSTADADAEIERLAGRTIREIFADAGEATFRELERRVIAELLRRDRLVLAAGGGAVLNPETRREMRSAGPVVWLRASIETLQQRISGDATTAARRPNLTADGGRAEIESLLARREPLYRETATLVIDTDGLDAGQIVERILETVAPQVRGGSDGGRD
jgi:shikimate kinase